MLPLTRPKQCLPFAVMTMKYNGPQVVNLYSGVPAAQFKKIPKITTAPGKTKNCTAIPSKARNKKKFNEKAAEKPIPVQLKSSSRKNIPSLSHINMSSASSLSPVSSVSDAGEEGQQVAAMQVQKMNSFFNRDPRNVYKVSVGLLNQRQNKQTTMSSAEKNTMKITDNIGGISGECRKDLVAPKVQWVRKKKNSLSSNKPKNNSINSSNTNAERLHKMLVQLNEDVFTSGTEPLHNGESDERPCVDSRLGTEYDTDRGIKLKGPESLVYDSEHHMDTVQSDCSNNDIRKKLSPEELYTSIDDLLRSIFAPLGNSKLEKNNSVNSLQEESTASQDNGSTKQDNNSCAVSDDDRQSECLQGKKSEHKGEPDNISVESFEFEVEEESLDNIGVETNKTDFIFLDNDDGSVDDCYVVGHTDSISGGNSNAINLAPDQTRLKEEKPTEVSESTSQKCHVTGNQNNCNNLDGLTERIEKSDIGSPEGDTNYLLNNRKRTISQNSDSSFSGSEYSLKRLKIREDLRKSCKALKEKVLAEKLEVNILFLQQKQCSLFRMVLIST